MNASGPNIRSLLFTALIAVCACRPVLAAEDPDWPCPQVLVPEISAAVLWDGPSIEGAAWREDKEVAALVEHLSARRTSADAASNAIAEFVAQLDPSERNARLTLVFAGVLETLNRDRAHLIDGIERYSRDQSRRAESIGHSLDALVELERKSSPEAAQQARDLRARLAIEERLFDERERSIPYLCRRPVVVEERLGTIARAIAGHMDP